MKTKYEQEEEEIRNYKFQNCCKEMTEDEIKEQLDLAGYKFHRPKIFFTAGYDGIMDLRANCAIEVEKLWQPYSLETPKKKKKEYPIDLNPV